jgi:hypothetical protein
MSTILIALMMEAANTFKTSINFYQTPQRNNPEDRHLHTRPCENLKSHKTYADQTLCAEELFLRKPKKLEEKL